MKKILLSLALLCLGRGLYAQQPYIYTIKADSVKITNTCDTAELIIENHTQNVPGFLFNKGKGRTEFRRALQKINESLYLIGADSLKLNAWLQGGNSFGTTGILGTNDNNHLDLYTNGIRRGRLDSIGRFSLEFPAGIAVDAFSLTTGNGTKKFFNIHSSVTGTFMSFNNLTTYGGDLESMRITASGTGSVFETFAYSDLSVKGFNGLDLYGGYGAGSTKYIRFFPAGNLAAAFSYNGNFLLGNTTDNGNKLQVNGSSWFGNDVFFSHPTYATGGMGAGIKWVDNNTFQIYGGPSHESLTFGPANWITSNAGISAPWFLATSPVGSDANYYVPAAGGVYSIPNAPPNGNTVYHKFTITEPVSNSGNGSPTLMEINKRVNRGAQDGLETGLRILFTVNGVANNLRALETVNGDVRLHTNSGRTSIGLDGSSTITSRLDVSGEQGYNQLRLRKKYTPTSSSDTNGAEGDVSWDDDYIYIKTSTGWKRSALSTF